MLGRKERTLGRENLVMLLGRRRESHTQSSDKEGQARLLKK